MTDVKIRKAFCWTCESCGTDQFEHGIMRRNQHKEDFMRHFPILGAVQQSVFIELQHPYEVTCKNCGATYKTYFYEKHTEEENPE